MNNEGIGLTVTLALWVAGCVVFGRVRNGAAGEGKAALVAPLSIIIPARNEEHHLRTLLRSFASPPLKPRQIIVVDDGSTDRSAELARPLGATVMPSPPRPDGWRGETWACHPGAMAATGEGLLLVDADTWFEPNLFLPCVGLVGGVLGQASFLERTGDPC